MNTLLRLRGYFLNAASLISIRLRGAPCVRWVPWYGVLALGFLALLAPLPLRAADDGQLRILLLGSSEAYQPDPDIVWGAEDAFPPGPIASNLEQILSHDTNILESVVVQPWDLIQTHADLISHTLMSWFYWPDLHTNNLGLLHQAWDYVVMIDDPHVACMFPEYTLEGVKQIGAEVREGGGRPLLVMTWSSGENELSLFGEMTYRVGDGTDTPVVPAGYAWMNVAPELQDAGQRPTPRGSYVTAAAIYSTIFGRSAKASGYVPPDCSPSQRDTLADTALDTIQQEATQEHYSGSYEGPTRLITPPNKKRYLECADFNSSTETGIWNALLAIFSLTRISAYRYTSSYQTFPLNIGHVIDFCQSRFWDNADTNYWRNQAVFDYQDDYGITSMVRSVDEVMYSIPSPEQESDADICRYVTNEGGYFVPVRLLWSRLRTAHPEIPCQPDGHHMSDSYLQGIATMMYTLLSGRCPIGDEPANPASSEWQTWYCRKTGYEIAWQLATLNSRAPGLEILPSAVNATSVTAEAIDTMTVRFRCAPTSTVSVAVSLDQPAAMMANPSCLLFTPQNYSNAQSVSIRATPAASNETVSVSFLVTSADGVFNQLFDQWNYRATRSATQTWAITQTETQAIYLLENGAATFSLKIAGATSNNTVLLPPVHGTLGWSGTNLVYHSPTNYSGPDSLTFWVTNSADLAIGSVHFTVICPEDIATFETWARVNGVPASGGGSNDTDQDGSMDLLEYAWGSLPRDTASQAGLDAEPGSPAVGFARIGFNRYVQATDLSFFVESANTLAAGVPWTCVLSNINAAGWNGPASYFESAPTSGVARVQVTDPDNTACDKFMRVRVKQ